jgi:hypothetical protein
VEVLAAALVAMMSVVKVAALGHLDKATTAVLV